MRYGQRGTRNGVTDWSGQRTGPARTQLEVSAVEADVTQRVVMNQSQAEGFAGTLGIQFPPARR